MAILRVWAHWTGFTSHPPLVAPVPASLSSYSGSVPQMAVQPAWTSTSAPTVNVWAELAKQSDIDSANWGGSSWPGPLPPIWPVTPPVGGDQGYSASAIGFQVTAVRILFSGTFPTGFQFTFISPSGAAVAVITPTVPPILPHPVSVPDGTGIWTIQIDRASGTGGNPTPSIVNAAHEPVVGLFGSNLENLIGIEFTGNEISSCPTLSLTAPTLSPVDPNNPDSSWIATGCAPSGTPQGSFVATVTPAQSGVQFILSLIHI